MVSTAALHLAVPVCEFAGCPHLCVAFPAGGPATAIENKIIQWVSSTECTDKNLDLIPGCASLQLPTACQRRTGRVQGTRFALCYSAHELRKSVFRLLNKLSVIDGQKTSSSSSSSSSLRIMDKKSTSLTRRKKHSEFILFYSATWHKSLNLVHYWIQRNHQHALNSKHSKLTELSELHRHTRGISRLSSPLTAGARLKCMYWIFIKPCVISQGVGL